MPFAVEVEGSSGDAAAVVAGAGEFVAVVVGDEERDAMGEGVTDAVTDGAEVVSDGAVVGVAALVDGIIACRGRSTIASTASVSAPSTSAPARNATCAAGGAGSRARQFGQKPETGRVRVPHAAHATGARSAMPDVLQFACSLAPRRAARPRV